MNMKSNKLSSPPVTKNTMAIENHSNNISNNSLGKIQCSFNPFRHNREIDSSKGSVHISNNNTNKPKMRAGSPTSTSSGIHTGKITVMRVGKEDELLKKHRKIIDNYLRRLGALMGKEISMNITDGIGYFSYGKFIVLIEVPTDHYNDVFIYTMVCRFEKPSTDNVALVLQRSMRLNYLGAGTRGSTLGWDGRDEINMSYTTSIPSLSFLAFQTAVEAFLVTAVEVNEKLDLAKHTPLFVPESRISY